jgi:hypothetical protein
MNGGGAALHVSAFRFERCTHLQTYPLAQRLPAIASGGSPPLHQPQAHTAVVAPRGDSKHGKPVARRGRKARSLASREIVRLPLDGGYPLPGRHCMRRALLFSFLLSSFFSARASAQTCVGMPSFASGQMQVAGGGTFADGANGFAGTFGFGAPNDLYGKASVGTMSYDGLNGSSVDFAVSGGYQAPLEINRTAEVCPMASLSFGSGPKNVGGGGVNLSSRTFAFGGSLGVLVNHSSQVQILPNAAFQFANTRNTIDDGTTSTSGSDSYALITLGTGFVFHSRFSVNPSITIPVKRYGSSTLFGLGGAINFGR